VQLALSNEALIDDFAPSWALAAAVVAIALAASMLTVRIGAAPALHRWHRWLHPTAVLGWMVATWLVGLRLLAADSLAETASRGLLLSIGVVVVLPVLRDVLAGLALVLEGRHRLGDDVRVDGHEGRIVALGLRSAVLRDRDGTETTLPYRRLADREIVRLSLAHRDAPCEFVVAIPDELELDAVSTRLLEAAMLSPYAAPGRRPEVFAVADERGGVRVRVRAYVFDRAYEERYRGDVLARAKLLSSKQELLTLAGRG
jgi:small-conductance mechanosensitive channel